MNSNKNEHKLILAFNLRNKLPIKLGCLSSCFIQYLLKHDLRVKLTSEKKKKTFRNFSHLKISVKGNIQTRHTDLRAAHRLPINIQKHHNKGQGSS